MIEQLLRRLGDDYPLQALDIGNMATLKANGMTFAVAAYQAEGLGHVSVMRAKGFFGLMKMDTLIINPTAVDLPLYSYDRIYAMGNDTLIIELYDTLLHTVDTAGLLGVQKRLEGMDERDPGEHWYDAIKLPCSLSKKGNRSRSLAFDDVSMDYLREYLAMDTPAVTDREAKKRKAAVYVEGLLKNGGPSTDVFKKSLGEETTAKLFREILFGTC